MASTILNALGATEMRLKVNWRIQKKILCVLLTTMPNSCLNNAG
ncbi:hypothetical protein [Candidatus Magnetaquicoccus inordinatus]|nr:hypothetical protein [Candidatus Magnetaquicoccus inordinatus]